MYPQTLRLAEQSAAVGADRKRAAYIIRKSHLDPDWASVDRRLLSIVNRAVSSLIQTPGLSDLNRCDAQRLGLRRDLPLLTSERRCA